MARDGSGTAFPFPGNCLDGDNMELRSLFIDFNAYFASVEQQDRPELRGRPIAVAPVMSANACCIAASYEAKRQGVKTGTLLREARLLCPDIRFVPARPALYVTYHHRLLALIHECIPTAYIGSIDEMACELLGRERERSRAVAIAHAIKARLAENVPAITASIGIAPNHFLAKTATDMQKPDGLVVLEAGDLPHALHRLQLRELCGIGRAMEKRLGRNGITTVAQLCSASSLALRQAWGGIEGEHLYRKLRGEWMPHTPANGRGSISHSHVLAPPMRNAAGVESVLKKLLQKAAMRLRSEKLVAGRLEARVKYLDRASWKETVFCNDTDDSHALLMQLSELLSHRPTGGRPLAVAVVLSGLCERIGTTDDLFATEQAREHAPLSALMDRINDRFGPQKIGYASSQAAAREAPMRIAFSRIPDIAHEDESFSRK